MKFDPVLNSDLWNIVKPYTSNPPVDEQKMIDEVAAYHHKASQELVRETLERLKTAKVFMGDNVDPISHKTVNNVLKAIDAELSKLKEGE